MTNIKCKRKEIDLLAMNPKTLERYHVEASVWTGSPFKRDRIEPFLKEKFDDSRIREKIEEIFGREDYKRILVLWDVRDLSLVPWCTANFNLQIWFIDDILNELMEKRVLKGSRDDVLRTIELLSLCQKESKRRSRASERKRIRKEFTPEKIEKSGKGMLEFKKRIEGAKQLERA